MTLSITTERLVLRRFTHDDVTDLLACVSDPSFARATPEIEATEKRFLCLCNRMPRFSCVPTFALYILPLPLSVNLCASSVNLCVPSGSFLMNILLKAILGGLITALIAWASTKGNVLPGILPMFPTLTLIALTIVGTQGDAQDVHQTCIATLKTLPAYLVFVLICTVAIKRVNFKAALLLGLGGWLLAALIVFLAPRALHRLG